MTKSLVAMLMTGAVASAMAAEPARKGGGAADSKAAIAPEAKRVVDRFVGTWKLDGTATGLPGAKGPAKATETVDCRRAAGGLVVSCTGRGKLEGVGDVEDVLLVTFDSGARNVRLIGMSSTGEVHDHVCAWKDDATLACELLSITMDGQPATVDLQFSWKDAKHMTFRETTTAKDGAKIAFEGNGSRR